MWELARHLLITKGKGQAPYELNSFDNALLEAGIANYNHSIQSSILPPQIVPVDFEERAVYLPPEGAILPTIYSRRHGHKGEQITAALAFGRNMNGDLPGLVYELSGNGDPREIYDCVSDMIQMAARQRGWKINAPFVEVQTLRVTEAFGCVLVAGVLLP